jgi:hypothetical protein
MAKHHRHHKAGRKSPIMQKGIKHAKGVKMGKSSGGTGHRHMRSGTAIMAAHMSHSRSHGPLPHGGKPLGALTAHRMHSGHKHRGG